MFRKPTVDGILADFTKKITQLEALYNTNEREISKNADEMSRLDVVNGKLAAEMGRAHAVKGKLAELIGS